MCLNRPVGDIEHSMLIKVRRGYAPAEAVEERVAHPALQQESLNRFRNPCDTPASTITDG